MAELTVQSIADSGLAPTYASAAGGGDEFTWSERAFLHVKNGDASAITVTISSQYSSPPDGTAAADLEVTVDGSGEKMIGPLNRQGYRDGDGMVQVGYSAVTSVTVGAFKMPD